MRRLLPDNTRPIRAMCIDVVRPYAGFLKEVALESLWPTRCAVCDAPGELLCTRCAAALPAVDRWRACPLCGAPLGAVQCSECNDVMLAALGREALPFDGCANAVGFNDDTGRIVKTWKDGGERRLVEVMAARMALVAEPSWVAEGPTVTPVPATEAALRRRGFDHGWELARTVAQALDLPLAQLLNRPRASDQRKLGKQERASNIAGRFAARPGMLMPRSALLVDDVCTTGATLFSACDALRAAGVEHIFALTFARVQ
ncbi:ComF family protein [Eggerthellaceae bacterium zg-893]|nr:ComF family protein [Eggerthellaceae bacterium zg-893]